MDEFDEFEGGFSFGCIGTIFKMIIALFFWGLVVSYIFEEIIDDQYGGIPYAPIGWKIAGIAVFCILIWRVASKPLNYFKRKGYGARETIVLGCLGFAIGGGLPVIGIIILFIYMFGTGQM